MKSTILHFINYFIKWSGLQLNKSGFEMFSAINRIKGHNIKIKSIIDIGASDGKWSRSVMPFFKNSLFFAVEPLIERQNALSELRKKKKSFNYIIAAAGEHDNEDINIKVTDDLDGSTVNGEFGVSRNVPSRSIDSIVKENNLRGPFLIKFDTHGFEVPILKGALKSLEETELIIMEVYNFRHTYNTLLFSEMVLLLDGYGFRCYDLADPSYRIYDNSFWQMDLFFAKKNSPIFSYESYK